MSTLKTTNLQHASAASPAIVLAADGTATAQLSSVNGGPFGGRNRVIGGCMRIDQRNAGASVTPAADSYVIDRFSAGMTQASKMTFQQSSTAPAGFNNSLSVTVASAPTVGSSDWFGFFHKIEGFNVADLGFGTASASTVTLSFWVRSSVTGTYGGSLMNSAQNRSYPYTYTISAANTWEKKTVTIAGDTSGTWLTTNGTGFLLVWSLGAGSTFLGTANTWGTTNALGTSGQINWVTNAGATFFLTGVQVEQGNTATPFERRSYGQELMLCQRYYQTSYAAGVAIQAATGVTDGVSFISINTSDSANGGLLPVTMRATPTFALYSTIGGTGSPSVRANDTGTTTTGITLNGGTTTNLPRITKSAGLPATGCSCSAQYTASAEL